MKQLILGDIHGRSIWKQIVELEKADKVIFIGDYVDTHENITGEQQLNNLLDIIEYKKSQPDKVILLIGNHDYQYWPGSPDIGTYTGYQGGMYTSFLYTFDQNKELFQMCHVDEHGTVYSHAGFTETFVEQRIGTFSEKNVNDVFRYKPASFAFYFGDRSGCGDDIHQSCIWVRPQSLYKDSIDKLQVVGHTSVGKINHPSKSERRGFYLIDALANRFYLVCEDGKFEVKQLDK